MGQGFFKASYFTDLSTVEYPAELRAEIEKAIAETDVLVCT